MDYSNYIQSAILSLTLAADAFAAAFAYGCMGTKIPFRSVVIINIVCTAMLAVALYAGSYVAELVPQIVGAVVCFAVLMSIGIIKLLQGLKSRPALSEITAKLAVLRPAEAAIIAAGLSLDGVAAGFGAALGGVNAPVMLTVSLFAHMAAIPLGCVLGASLSRKSRRNIAWLGGAVIIVLAFLQLL
ncbi:MAG: manganese efflux pump [Oscillospiraceae bacterium]|nr:manganese efflux pump [Oscillospiraceae bacterium]